MKNRKLILFFVLVVLVVVGVRFLLDESVDLTEPIMVDQPDKEFSFYDGPEKSELVDLIKRSDVAATEVYIHVVLGGYASGGAGGEDGPGYLWLAQRVDRAWKLIARGNETWSCQMVDSYKVPIEVYRVCIDYRGGGIERRLK